MGQRVLIANIASLEVNDWVLSVKYLFISLFSLSFYEMFVYFISGKAKTVNDWNHQTISL